MSLCGLRKNILSNVFQYPVRDKIIVESVTKRKPLALLSPESQTFQTILRMAYKIVNAKKIPYFLLDIEDYDDSLIQIK